MTERQFTDAIEKVAREEAASMGVRLYDDDGMCIFRASEEDAVYLTFLVPRNCITLYLDAVLMKIDEPSLQELVRLECRSAIKTLRARS